MVLMGSQFSSLAALFDLRWRFTGPAIGESVQHSARIGHRRVVFQIDWPEMRMVVLTLVDCGQARVRVSGFGFRA